MKILFIFALPLLSSLRVVTASPLRISVQAGLPGPKDTTTKDAGATFNSNSKREQISRPYSSEDGSSFSIFRAERNGPKMIISSTPDRNRQETQEFLSPLPTSSTEAERQRQPHQREEEHPLPTAHLMRGSRISPGYPDAPCSSDRIERPAARTRETQDRPDGNNNNNDINPTSSGQPAAPSTKDNHPDCWSSGPHGRFIASKETCMPYFAVEAQEKEHNSTTHINEPYPDNIRATDGFLAPWVILLAMVWLGLLSVVLVEMAEYVWRWFRTGERDRELLLFEDDGDVDGGAAAACEKNTEGRYKNRYCYEEEDSDEDFNDLVP